MGDIYSPGLEVPLIISPHIPLLRTWSCGHASLQGSLGDVVQPVLKEEKNGFGGKLVTFTDILTVKLG